MNNILRALTKRSFDYVVVGAGSAGCAIASRLAENPNLKVALIEAGPPDTSLAIHIPIGIVSIIGIPGMKSINWYYENAGTERYTSAPLSKKFYQPRGKTLGGSSSINAMVYIRGNKGDYDNWAALGNKDWEYEKCLPYFKKAEHNEDLYDQYHGQDGPLNVRYASYQAPVVKELIQTFVDEGIPHNKDFNGKEQTGVGFYQTTTKDGRRWSAAAAYLREPKPNLSVFTNSHATQLVIESNEAHGVVVKNTKTGESTFFEAERETIVSQGAFNSPQLLQLSGIGPSELLKTNGIEVKVDLPGVGENLHDHPDILLNMRTTTRTTFCTHPLNVPAQIKEVFSYITERKGFPECQAAEAGGFITVNKDEAYPDVQYHFVPGILVDHARKLQYGNGGSVHICAVRPKSRGNCQIVSKDPFAPPRIVHNYLKDRSDVDLLVNAVRYTNKILHNRFSHKVTEFMTLKEKDPSDATIEDLVKKSVDTIYHPVGTCKMGNDNMSVVDDRLRVHGVQKLRVADASIMPQVISGNTNATSIMIGERCADFILNN